MQEQKDGEWKGNQRSKAGEARAAMVKGGPISYTRGLLPATLLPVIVSSYQHTDLKTRGLIPRQKLLLVKKL